MIQTIDPRFFDELPQGDLRRQPLASAEASRHFENVLIASDEQDRQALVSSALSQTDGLDLEAMRALCLKVLRDNRPNFNPPVKARRGLWV